VTRSSSWSATWAGTFASANTPTAHTRRNPSSRFSHREIGTHLEEPVSSYGCRSASTSSISTIPTGPSAGIENLRLRVVPEHGRRAAARVVVDAPHRGCLAPMAALAGYDQTPGSGSSCSRTTQGPLHRRRQVQCHDIAHLVNERRALDLAPGWPCSPARAFGPNAVAICPTSALQCAVGGEDRGHGGRNGPVRGAAQRTPPPSTRKLPTGRLPLFQEGFPVPSQRWSRSGQSDHEALDFPVMERRPHSRLDLAPVSCSS